MLIYNPTDVMGQKYTMGRRNHLNHVGFCVTLRWLGPEMVFLKGAYGGSESWIFFNVSCDLKNNNNNSLYGTCGKNTHGRKISHDDFSYKQFEQ